VHSTRRPALKTVLLTSVLLSLSTLSTEAEDGFQDIPWGSPPETVIGRFGTPDDSRWDEPEGLRCLIYNDAELLSYKKFVSLIFFFEDGQRLVTVCYYLFDCPAARGLYRELENALVYKYGEGFEKRNVVGRGWRSGVNTQIELVYNEDGVFLRYLDITAAEQRYQQMLEKL